MLTTRCVRPKARGVLHVVHETETARLYGDVQTLCGERFSLATVETFKNKYATCQTCEKRDNPFELSQQQDVLFWKIAAKMPDGKIAQDLFVRDLFHVERGPNGAFIVDDIRLSPKGDILYRDIKLCVPWYDADGILHKRRAMHRGRAVCGATLYGLQAMTYVRLDQMMELHEKAKVDCIDCLADPHG